MTTPPNEIEIKQWHFQGRYHAQHVDILISSTGTAQQAVQAVALRYFGFHHRTDFSTTRIELQRVGHACGGHLTKWRARHMGPPPIHGIQHVRD